MTARKAKLAPRVALGAIGAALVDLDLVVHLQYEPMRHTCEATKSGRQIVAAGSGEVFGAMGRGQHGRRVQSQCGRRVSVGDVFGVNMGDACGVASPALRPGCRTPSTCPRPPGRTCTPCCR